MLRAKRTWSWVPGIFLQQFRVDLDARRETSSLTGLIRPSCNLYANNPQIKMLKQHIYLMCRWAKNNSVSRFDPWCQSINISTLTFIYNEVINDLIYFFVKKESTKYFNLNRFCDVSNLIFKRESRQSLVHVTAKRIIGMERKLDSSTMEFL